MNKYYRSLVLADGQDGQPHVELKRTEAWGQSPEIARMVLHKAFVLWEDNDGTWGALKSGDRVRFLTGAAPQTNFPRAGDPVRVLVQTHDGRRVGHSGNAVWIVWPGVREARRIFRICSD